MLSRLNTLRSLLFFLPMLAVCNGYGQSNDSADATGTTLNEDIAALSPAARIAQQVSNGNAQTRTQAPLSDRPVAVSAFDTVTLNVQNTDLAKVLELLSIEGRRNIIPSSAVQGQVTANLYDVTFHEALHAILTQNGCTFVEKGNFIYVYTAAEMAQMEAATRTPQWRIFKLNYITAEDASQFVKPLLSSAGAIENTNNVAPGFVPSESDGGANSFANHDTLLVRDYPENLDQIENVLMAIDEKPQQVLVEATILKAELTEDLAFGVDFSILTDIAVDAFTSPLNVISPLIDGTVAKPTNQKLISATQSSVGNVRNGDGGLKVGILSNNVAAFIRALDEITDTTIIANPKLLTLNRQRAEVLVGDKKGYLSTTATATATTQTVEFAEGGTKLTLRPFLSADGTIRLELKPSISVVTTRDVVGSANVVTIPDESTQELTTNVMVRDGQTVVLGGLFKEETTISRNQIPGVGDIPLLGALARGKNDSVVRTEVIFLITPHIVEDRSLEMAGDHATEGVQMIRMGTREGLLPWSRDKLTTNHLRQALTAMENDNTDRAMWEIDLALMIDPTQIEAIRLKEQLQGRRNYWPARSLLNDVVDVLVEQQTAPNAPNTPNTPDTAPDTSNASHDSTATGGQQQVGALPEGIPLRPAQSSDTDVHAQSAAQVKADEDEWIANDPRRVSADLVRQFNPDPTQPMPWYEEELAKAEAQDESSDMSTSLLESDWVRAIDRAANGIVEQFTNPMTGDEQQLIETADVPAEHAQPLLP